MPRPRPATGRTAGRRAKVRNPSRGGPKHGVHGASGHVARSRPRRLPEHRATCETGQQTLGRVLLHAQAEARMTQEAELDRRPGADGSPARRSRQPVEIGGRERAMPDQGLGSDGMPNRRACSSAVKICRRIAGCSSAGGSALELGRLMTENRETLGKRAGSTLAVSRGRPPRWGGDLRLQDLHRRPEPRCATRREPLAAGCVKVFAETASGDEDGPLPAQARPRGPRSQ